jgi:hypothetical protein
LLDGFGTGEGQSLEAPFGHAGERLHDWLIATQWFHEMSGEPGGIGGVDEPSRGCTILGSAPSSWVR